MSNIRRYFFLTCFILSSVIGFSLYNYDSGDAEQVLRETMYITLIDQDISSFHLVESAYVFYASTENIEGILLPKFSTVQLVPMTPNQLVEKANRDGIFLALRVSKFDLDEDRAYVKIKYFHVIPNKRGLTSRDRGLDGLSGGEFGFQFFKTDNSWEGELRMVKIS